MNLSDQYYPDLFLLNKTMFFVQKFIIIIFLLDSSVNKDSRQMSISDNPPRRTASSKIQILINNGSYKIQSKRNPKQENSIMNNFHYQEKFVTECPASIMGEMIYRPKLRYHGIIQAGKFKRSEKHRTVGSK
jgi:hypothetical protein